MIAAAIIGIVVVVAILAYTLYKILTPEEILDDFDEDYDEGFNDFDEDYDDDDDFVEPVSIMEVKQVKASATDDELDDEEDAV